VPPASILFVDPEGRGAEPPAAPHYFGDLNLDIVATAILEGHGGFGLEALLWAPLLRRDDVKFRQEVFRDLDGTAMSVSFREFTDTVGAVRDQLTRSDRAKHDYEQQRWHLDAAVAYCDAVLALNEALGGAELQSRGLRRAGAYVLSYVESAPFMSLARDACETSTALAGVTYCISIEAGRVRVSPFRGEPDHGSELDKTFARFAPAAPGEGDEPGSGERDEGGIDHVETQVLELVAQHFPEAFSQAAVFSQMHRDFLDTTIMSLDGEAHFYLAVLDYVDKLRSADLRFCYPEIVDHVDQSSVSCAFDLALAGRLVERKDPVVSNDFHFDVGEHIFVVTGPNQGGKTTFARMVGQVHHFAALGCPVPALAAKVPLSDQMFTHFARQEQAFDRRGALEDDLIRAHSALRSATARSLLIFNEIFTSTTNDDAAFLGTRILEEVLKLGARCVYVTFVDELACFDETVVSMVAKVREDDPSDRTYKLARQPADGRAYAAALAQKYGLSYRRLKERVAP
jgi:DNA mismatch repair protein MutS